MSEQPQPTLPDSEIQTEPTLFEKIIAGTERISKDATQYVAGLTEGETPREGTTVTEHDLRMRKAGKELAGEFNRAAVQGVVYVAGCADAVSKSLHAQYTEPVVSEEKADEGLTFQKIMEVTIKSLAETADALSFTMKETEKNLTKCKNPKCTCDKCACAEGSCQCGTGTETKLPACKNANCTCATCECAEGSCQCGTGTETKLPACKNANCTCATCECAEGSCQCGTATEAKLPACNNPNCTCATCECAEGSCQCGTAKSADAESENTTKGTDCGCEK